MKKFHALLLMFILCAVSSMPLMRPSVRATRRCDSEPRLAIPFTLIKHPNRLREMFETGEKPEPARGGRDFEPGRPQPVDNKLETFTDSLAEKGVGLPSALAEIKASTNGTPVDPSLRALRRLIPPATLDQITTCNGSTCAIRSTR